MEGKDLNMWSGRAMTVNLPTSVIGQRLTKAVTGCATGIMSEAHAAAVEDKSEALKHMQRIGHKEQRFCSILGIRSSDVRGVLE